MPRFSRGRQNSPIPTGPPEASGGPACPSSLADAVDQTGTPVQHHLPQLLHRIEPEQRQAGLYHRAEAAALSRRDRARRLADARDRLHRRRAVHKPGDSRHDRGRARPRLLGPGADQRHAAHAAPARRDGLSRSRSLRRRLALRVALDHYTQALHEAERGPGPSTRRSTASTGWRRNGFSLARRRPHLLGRERGGRCAPAMPRLIARTAWPVDADDPGRAGAVPGDGRARRRAGDHRGLLGHPRQVAGDVMCASSRMVVKRKGADAAGRGALHAAALRCRVRDGATLAETLRRTAACSTTAPSSSTTPIAPSSACSAAAPARPDPNKDPPCRSHDAIRLALRQARSPPR